jgi:hypothetical protein
MPKLIISIDGVVVKEALLTKDRSTIGRRPYNDVVIDNLAVSGEHALIQMVGDTAVLEDLGSTNGTFVNGRAVRKQTLADGDVIEIGRCAVRYQVHAGTVAGAPAAEVEGLESDLASLPVPPAGRGARVRVLTGAARARAVADQTGHHHRPARVCGRRHSPQRAWFRAGPCGGRAHSQRQWRVGRWRPHRPAKSRPDRQWGPCGSNTWTPDCLPPRAAPPWRTWACIALLLLALAQSLSGLPAPGRGWLDAQLADLRLGLSMPRTRDTRVVIVDVDEASLQRLGRWPWSRAHRAAGARADRAPAGRGAGPRRAVVPSLRPA